jgi:hypothetical protein
MNTCRLPLGTLLGAFLYWIFCSSSVTAQGVLSNGSTYYGAILVAGQANNYTFTANAGDNILIKVGKITSTNNFVPRLRLINPNSMQQASASDSFAPEIVVSATNTGTFTVIVDDTTGTIATGTYSLTMVKTGSPLVITPGYAGGALTNGSTYQAGLPVGALDAWSFTATAGEAIVVRAGESSATNNFVPWVRLYGPNGSLLGSSDGVGFGEVTVQATNSGTFLVVIDNNPYYNTAGEGTYILTLAETGSPLVITPGEPGGLLTNGSTFQAGMPVGGLDAWSFTATAGEAIVVRAGESSSTNDFVPWVRLYGPNGSLLGSSYGLGFGEVAVQATNSGTFLVVIGNNPYYSEYGDGSYILSVAETGSPLVITPGYSGGSMTNGSTYQAGMPIGALNAWNFTATAGEAIVVRAGESSSTNDFVPWVRLYGPDGSLLGSSYGLGFGEVAVQATNSGTFLVVIGNNPYYNDAADGTYILTLAETGSPLVITPGDPGGPLSNGSTYQAGIPIGGLDAWSFTATAGETFVVRAGETSSTNNFAPWVRLYGPNGALLGSSFGTGFGEVTLQATNSGTFLVVVGNNPYYNDSADGTYVLTLAETGSPLMITPGYQGGSLTGANGYNGNITVGAIEPWTFTICAGDYIVVRAAVLSSTNNFDCWVRLYGPNGALLGSDAGTTFGEVALQATNSGTFLVVVGNNPYYSDLGSGTYLLTANGLSDGFKTCAPFIAGSTLSVGGVGGTPGTNAVLLTTTNITTPAALWTAIRTNSFDQFGVFAYTNAFNPNEAQRFFRLLLP